MHLFVCVTSVNAFLVRKALVCYFPQQVYPLQAVFAAATDMDVFRRQGNSGYMDVSRSHVPSKRQAATAVSEFVFRREKAFRGERGPQAPPGHAVHRPPRSAVKQAKASHSRRITSQEASTMEKSEGTSKTDVELPPPSIQLPIGTLHGAAVEMASFMASGGRERPATLKRSPTARGTGANTTANLGPFRFGVSGSSAADSPAGGAEEPLIRTRSDCQSNQATDISVGMPLAASLAATLFPPVAPRQATDGVTVGGSKAGRAGCRTSICGRP